MSSFSDEIASLRDLFAQSPSQASWRTLCQRLDEISSEEVDAIRDYVASHLVDWPDVLRLPPYAWWTRAKRGEPPAFWSIATRSCPFDEIFAVFQCQCLSLTSRVEHMEAALLVCRRDAVEIHDVDGHVAPLRLLSEELKTIQPEPCSWYGVEEDDSGLRLLFSDGESLELGFGYSTELREAMVAWQRISAQQIPAMPPPSGHPLPHPAYSEITHKWNVWFEVPKQELSTLLACRPDDFLVTWKETEQGFPLQYIRSLTNLAWEHLSPPSQHCLCWICDVFESRWGEPDENEEDFFDYIPLAMLRQALEEALPHAEGLLKGRSKRLHQMLKQSEGYATLVEITLHWGY